MAVIRSFRFWLSRPGMVSRSEMGRLSARLAASWRMRCSLVLLPGAGGLGGLPGQDGLEGVVLGGIVGGAVVPAAPDDVAPGAGGDADGERVVLAAGAGIVVDGRGPRAGVPGVGGEVTQGVAELAVDRPPEAVGDAGAGPAGDRGDPGQPGQ